MWIKNISSFDLPLILLNQSKIKDSGGMLRREEELERDRCNSEAGGAEVVKVVDLKYLGSIFQSNGE